MQRALAILGIAIVLGGVCIGVLWWASAKSGSGTPSDTYQGQQYPTVDNSNTVVPGKPQTGGSRDTLTLPSMAGGGITANNFLKDPSVVPDPSNPGHYYLAGQYTVSNQNPAYTIVYITSDQSFVITLNREPIGQVRQAAEQDLIAKLGIKQILACNLRYWVGVPDQLNPLYSGKNLGFSFCPGSTALQ